jgi:hypothetical protein
MILASNWVDFAVALVWPLFAIAAIAVVLTPPGRRAFGPVLGRLKTFKAGGFEFDLTPTGATAARGEIEDTFQTYRASIRREFDRMARIYNVPEKHSAVLESLRNPVLPKDIWGNLRSTIHVPDILFADAMYQLLDYYPAGGGGGRAFPVRRGVLGLAWRIGEAQIEGEVPTDPRKLVIQWAMTSQEATAAGQGRKSFLCVVLRDSTKSPVGVFYLDSTKPDAFGEGRPGAEDSKIVFAINRACEKFGLTEALGKLGEEMRRRGPAIRIFDVA